MKDLKNKSILFLAPKFFGYEIEIKNELEKQGAKVFYFDERPKNDFLTKVFIRLNFKMFINKKIQKYYEVIIKETRNCNFDYIFLVSPETISMSIIQEIKENHPNAKVVTYMWDSIKNKKNAFSLLEVSDKFFTFDPNDIQLYERIIFLPLFYINDYQNIYNKSDDLLYDISFVGTIHSDRYKIIKGLSNRFNVFYYFFSPSKILFKLQKIFKSNFKDVKLDDVNFNSLSKEEIIDIVSKSNAIIDIEHSKQVGLTMRTIEMLGAKKKFITTNKNIVNYDFYKSSNILVIDRNNPILDEKFISIPYEEIDENIYNNYSIKNWVVNIFRD